MTLFKKNTAAPLFKPISRAEFRKNVSSYFKVFYASLIPGLCIFAYGKYAMNIDFTIVGLIVLCIALVILQARMAHKMDIYSRLLDIFPDLPKTRMAIFSFTSVSMIPLFFAPLLVFLWCHEGASQKPAPFIFKRSQMLTVVSMGIYFLPMLIVFLKFFDVSVVEKAGSIAYWSSGASMAYIANISDETEAVLVSKEVPNRKIPTVAFILYTAKQVKTAVRKPSEEDSADEQKNRFNTFLDQSSRTILATNPDMVYSYLNPLYLLNSASMAESVLLVLVDEVMNANLNAIVMNRYQDIKEKKPDLNWQEFNSSIANSQMMTRIESSQKSVILPKISALMFE